MDEIKKVYEGKRCIVRCYGAGVFFAEVAALDGKTAVLHNARRLWYWDGAASLSQLANEGVKQPRACKFTVTVDELVVTEVLEVIPCTDAACASIDGVLVWKM